MAESDEIPLDEKQKKKFVKNMMEMADKARVSSEDEIHSKIQKELRRKEIIEFIIYMITFAIAGVIIYLNVK